MASGKDLPNIGGFIRDLRRSAKISLRQLSEQAGVSNPYLSQIERGLRKPSAEVLQQLASALRVSTPAMYLRAGLLDDREGQGVLAAIAVDPDLTMAQKQSLTQIYETFRRENARLVEATAAADAASAESATGPVTTESATGPVTTESVAAVPTVEAATGTVTTESVASPPTTEPESSPARPSGASADLANIAVTGPTTTGGTPTGGA